jgi:hypothetical protein
MKLISLCFLIVCLFLIACWPNKEEQKVLNNLNIKYEGKYEFKAYNDYYLRIYILDNKIDTLELQKIYLESMVDITNEPTYRKQGLPWIYLNVNNNNGDFLFRMSWDSHDDRFFYKDREYD